MARLWDFTFIPREGIVEYPTGWTCELTLVKLELYLRGTLSRADALAVAEHLEACAACAQHLILWRPAGADAGSRRARGRRG